MLKIRVLEKFRAGLRKLLLPHLIRLAYGKVPWSFKTDIAQQYCGVQLCFESLLDLGIPVATVIDVGASDARWSRAAVPYFSDAHFLLIEANPVHEEDLQKFCEGAKREYMLAAAGRGLGTVYFDMSSPFGGLARESFLNGDDCCIPSTSIDHEVAKRRLSGPFMVKLDTHGFEVPILEGARDTLRETSVAVIEAYGFKLTPECLKFYELCAYMNDLGFSVFDICSPMWREKDCAIWQMDIVFLRSDMPLFGDNAYL
ncbi:FkbM family methyltransferase [Nitratidesulfovibrio sp. SRB-5]|uniref:FkbM family methyltransferase n=1 Tax=Nitratidesulfovibrio sp. SRB-5 TaxID=2872636 RepID=UPI0010261316|nr:FkbM family methyltransferase [Nitratidesulfovibrio sp. SRB-5]MBZ2170884.1 FkbM family methyltransferase [Nitratidesulfovibrio sp. SRB-5]RXF78119.1 FkbM family methyltransferase [Desulfovibrio sp. DS-1]